jgi:mannosyltransferase
LSQIRAQAGEGLSPVGEQANVAAWYQGLSLVVQPTHSEGFSLVLLEALASGCCVVAANLPHFPRWIEHGRTGFLYPPGDVKALTEHLRFLFAHPEEAQAVAARAAERARVEMGVDREASALARIYDGLLGAA